MFGDGRVREIQIARYVRARRSTRRRPQRQRAAVSGDDFYRINPGSPWTSPDYGPSKGPSRFGITAKRDDGNGSVVRSIPTVNGSDRRVSGGPEGALSPKWAKPPHIQEHSTGGQESEKYKVLWAPTPAPAPQMQERVRGSRPTAYVTMSDAVLDPYGVLCLFLVSPKWIGCRFACGFVSFFSR